MTPSFIVEQIWILLLILFSFIGTGTVGVGAYMRFWYKQPESKDALKIEFLIDDKKRLEARMERLEKENNELVKLLLDTLK